MTPSQILKLIKSYTSDDCEDSISPAFIEKLTKKLNPVSFLLSRLTELMLKLFLSIPQQTENETFTMNENEVRILSVIFKYNDIKLEDIDIPDVFKLKGLVTKI